MHQTPNSNIHIMQFGRARIATYDGGIIAIYGADELRLEPLACHRAMTVTSACSSGSAIPT